MTCVFYHRRLASGALMVLEVHAPTPEQLVVKIKEIDERISATEKAKP